jgi:hypothetical protein
MSGALAKLLSYAGKSPDDFTKNSSVGKILRRSGVKESAELRRITALPRREWSKDEPGFDEFLANINEWLKMPRGSMTLRPIQAKALAELHDYGGLFGPQAVGSGKTLVSFLAPIVLDAKRPLLILPAKLREKTIREMARYQEHFRIRPIPILSYEMLGREQGEQALRDAAPDLIIADECHRLKNFRAAVTRRVARWMREQPTTRFVALSGTITKRSLRDYAHIIKWCLPYGSPLPVTQHDLEEWSSALDEKIEDMQRLGVGGLVQLCRPDEVAELMRLGDDKALALVRRAFQRRLTETPGVVATSETALGSSLRVLAVQPALGTELDAAFRKLRNDWMTPDDHPIIDGFQLWRHARELACGFYYRWNPRPPEEWLNARRNWARFVREVLAEHRPGLDSELPVARACSRGELPTADYEAWREIRDTFKPNQEAVWISDGTLRFAADWLSKNEGVCWVEHIAFGERLAELSGLPYYGSGGLDRRKRMIEEETGSCIASVLANAEGRNLQHWNKSLVISCQPSGLTWEQLLGRMHREGQTADEVSYEVMFACKEQMDGFFQALADARYLQDSLGSPQKLLYADVVLDLQAAVGPRWS